VAWCGQRVEPDVQGVVVGDDAAGAGHSGANEGVGLVGAGMAGIDDDRAGEGSGRVVGGDADGVIGSVSRAAHFDAEVLSALGWRDDATPIAWWMCRMELAEQLRAPVITIESRFASSYPQAQVP
jgi:hypothetical protein